MRKFLALLLVAVAATGTMVVWKPSLFPVLASYLPVSLQADAATEKSGAKPGASASGSQQSGKRRGGGPISVAVATAERRDIPLIERTYGEVQPLAVAQVNARITSQVASILVGEGSLVKQGDLLVTLDDRALQAQYAKDKAALAKDEAVERSAAADLERAKSLMARKAGTQQAYDQALSAHQVALANIEADKAAIQADEVQLSYTRISAPISGRLGAINVSVGDVVSPTSSTSLMTITPTAPLKVVTRLPEVLLASIRSGDAKLRAFAPTSKLKLDEGRVDFINSTVDTASGTITLSAIVPNTEGQLWPGQHVNVEIEHGVLAAATVVPAVAVQQGQGGAYVWLIEDGKTVKQQAVTVSRNEGELAAVAEGLQPGAVVVTEGQLRLANGSAVKIVGGGLAAEQSADASSEKKAATP